MGFKVLLFGVVLLILMGEVGAVGLGVKRAGFVGL